MRLIPCPLQGLSHLKILRLYLLTKSCPVIFGAAKSVLGLNGSWYVRTRHNLGHLAAAIILNSLPSIFDGPPPFVITVMATLHDIQGPGFTIAMHCQHCRHHKKSQDRENQHKNCCLPQSSRSPSKNFANISKSK